MWYVLAVLAACAAVSAQTLSTILVSSPSDTVLCGRTVALQAAGLDPFGASVDFAPRWRSLNESAATVDSRGTVKALRPGIVEIEAADPGSGVSARYSLTIVPLRIEISPARPVLRVGESLKLSAAALDADSKPLEGARFQWVSGIGGIAKLASDGTLIAMRAGSLTVSAVLQTDSGPLNFSSAITVSVYRKSDYTLTRLLSSADPAPAPSLIAPTSISAAGDNLLALIGDLSNGGQALILSENGVPRVLATTGQFLPSAGKIVSRFTGVSVNRSGDVVATVQFPAEYCDTELVLFRRGQPESVLEAACNINITDRALDDKGNVIYYTPDNGSDRFFLRPPDAPRRQILQGGDKLDSTTAGRLGRASLTAGGSALLEVFASNGSQKLYRWDGARFQALASVGDFYGSAQVNGMDLPVESSAGDLYARFTFSDGARAMQYTGSTWSVLAQSNTPIGSTRLFWIYRIAPAGGGGVAFVADSDGGSGVFRVAGGGLEKLSPLPSGNNVTQIAGGAATFFAVGGFGAKSLSVYQLGGGRNGPLLALPWTLPTGGSTAILWDTLPERQNAAAPIVRLPGDSLGRISNGAIQLVAGPSSALNDQPATGLGNVVTAADGSAIFVMNTGNGPVLARARDGRVEVVADTVSKRLASGLSILNWYDYGGASPYAINGAGQFVATANSGNIQHLWRFDLAKNEIIDIAGGPSYGYIARAALDPSGRVAFMSYLPDGSQGLFLWENGTLRKMLQSGDSGLVPNQRINGVNNVQFAGGTLLARIQYQQTTIIQAFDGKSWQPFLAPGDVLSFGRPIDGFAGAETMANAAGDVAFLARGSGYISLVVRTHDGRDVLVASTGEPLPDGSWPIFFYGFSLTASGDLLFVAETVQDGRSTMALYRAAPSN